MKPTPEYYTERITGKILPVLEIQTGANCTSSARGWLAASDHRPLRWACVGSRAVSAASEKFPPLHLILCCLPPLSSLLRPPFSFPPPFRSYNTLWRGVWPGLPPAAVQPSYHCTAGVACVARPEPTAIPYPAAGRGFPTMSLTAAAAKYGPVMSRLTAAPPPPALAALSASVWTGQSLNINLVASATRAGGSATHTRRRRWPGPVAILRQQQPHCSSRCSAPILRRSMLAQAPLSV